MVSAGADLKKIFPLPKMGVFVDGKVEAIEMNLIQMLGLPTSRNEKKSSPHFCNLGTCELESDKKPIEWSKASKAAAHLLDHTTILCC